MAAPAAQSSCISTMLLLLFVVTVAEWTPKVSSSPSCISSVDKEERVGLKKAIYGGFALQNANSVADGAANPVENYDWTNAVIIYWEILPDMIEVLEDKLNFAAAGVTIAPIHLIDTEDEEESKFLLSLNCKQVDVSDQDPITTNQCDWMLHVYAPQSGPEPTLMIVDSIYDFNTVSPLGSISQSLVDILVADDDGNVDAQNSGTSTVKVDIDSVDTQFEFLLDTSLMSTESLSKDFAFSFDKLYWPNGVYSRIHSDGTLSSAKPLVLTNTQSENGSLDDSLVSERKKGSTKKKTKRNKGGRGKKKSKSSKSSSSSEDDDTEEASRGAITTMALVSPWTEFIDQIPHHVMYFPETIGLNTEVWVNVADVDLDLSITRSEIYSNRAMVEGTEVSEGLRQAIAMFVVDTANVPSYYMNFRISEDKLQDLMAAISLPSNISIIPMRMRKNGPLEYIITLNVYEATGLAPGIRFEWSMFVKLEGMPNEPHFFVLEAVSSTPSFDPVNLFTAPALSVAYNLEMGILTTSYALPNDVSFSAAFPMPDPCDPPDQSSQRNTGASPFPVESACDQLLREFWTANDNIYWGNGIYDRGTYDGNIVATPISIVDLSEITVDISKTPWAEFLEPNPSDLLVIHQSLHFLISPMFNVEQLDVCAQ